MYFTQVLFFRLFFFFADRPEKTIRDNYKQFFRCNGWISDLCRNWARFFNFDFLTGHFGGQSVKTRGSQKLQGGICLNCSMWCVLGQTTILWKKIWKKITWWRQTAFFSSAQQVHRWQNFNMAHESSSPVESACKISGSWHLILGVKIQF